MDKSTDDAASAGSADVAPTMPTVCLLSPAHIWVNPRLRKEADTLTAAGYDVVVGYRAADTVDQDDIILANRPWRWHRVDVSRRRAPSRWLASRVRERTAQAVWRSGARHPSVARAAYCAADLALLEWAKAQRADLFVAHTQPLLAIAAEAAAYRRVPYAFDCEDLLAEEAADGGRASWRRRLVVSLERLYLPGAAYVSATSAPMADYLAAAYGLREVPVWHNCFPLSERAGVAPPVARPTRPIIEITWISATIGPGRGLEDGCAAITQLAPSVVLHVYGRVVPETARWVADHLGPLQRKGIVVIHPPIASEAVIPTIAKHHIGLSLDGDDCLNRSVTVSNKFFYYLQAGLVCVATDTPGHRSVVPPGAGYGMLYPVGDGASLTCVLRRLLVRETLVAAQQAAWEAGEHTYAWDRYRPRVVATVAGALRGTTPRGRTADPLEAARV